MLTDAAFSNTYLQRANLNRAELSNGVLLAANLEGADLSEAKLIGVHLSQTNMIGAKLTRTDLSHAMLHDVILADVDLSSVIGLETCAHIGPSVIDFRTLQLSHPLPLVFLRGVGLPDTVIDYLPSLVGQAIQYFSCFISYSSKDEDFAKRLHADLQSSGVRCWFAPHDLPIGGKILDEIDAAIRLREKVLLVLSEHSIKSDWVEDEVTGAFEEERNRGLIVLFPIRLDDAVMETQEPWAAKLRSRNIGNFCGWKNHEDYQRTLDRVLRDLKTGSKAS